jgi:ribosomal protein S18 acetylase RimI-like enzyme
VTDFTALERAAFDSWPALEEQDFRGWRLRFASGYTKRANSANATLSSETLAETDIEWIEHSFRKRNIPPVFRLPSFCGQSAVDRRLAEKRYSLGDRSLVMTRPAAGGDRRPSCRVLSDAGDWLAAFQQVSSHGGTGQQTHLALLRSIRGKPAFAVREVDGEALCCGLGVLVGDLIGIFDVATRDSARRRGLARDLCRDLLAWGYEAGAKTAFLQVIEANGPAVALYRSLGFEDSYRYWYRLAPAP